MVCKITKADRPWLFIIALLFIGWILLLVIYNIFRDLPPSYDYIIVGAGTSGCVIAANLVNAGFSVALIEAGTTTQAKSGTMAVIETYTIYDIPALWSLLQDFPNYWWPINDTFHTEAGIGLGGSGVTNGMLFFRPNPSDFDSWPTNWKWEDLLPYYIMLENVNTTSLTGDIRGYNGNTQISIPENINIIYEKILNSTSNINFPIGFDYNNGQERFGFYLPQYNIRNGVRDSTLIEYLVPILSDANLNLQTQTEVDSIIIENNIAKGVNIVNSGQISRINVKKEIILTAGALNTPAILQRSGVGNPDLLSSLNIKTVYSAVNVGENLWDHICITTSYQPNEIYRFGDIKSVLTSYLITASGELACGTTGVLLFLDTTANNVNQSDTIIYFNDAEEDSLNVVICYQNITNSLGSVQLQSNENSSISRRDPTNLEVAALAIGIEQVRQILSTSPFSAVSWTEISPGSSYTGTSLQNVIPSLIQPARDYVGTCKIGESNDPMAVVDTTLRVKGIKNLRVIDASIIPTVPFGNIYATVLAIALKGSDLILNKSV